jgi:hypothetical protein
MFFLPKGKASESWILSNRQSSFGNRGELDTKYFHFFRQSTWNYVKSMSLKKKSKRPDITLKIVNMSAMVTLATYWSPVMGPAVWVGGGRLGAKTNRLIGCHLIVTQNLTPSKRQATPPIYLICDGRVQSSDKADSQLQVISKHPDFRFVFSGNVHGNKRTVILNCHWQIQHTCSVQQVWSAVNQLVPAPVPGDRHRRMRQQNGKKWWPANPHTRVYRWHNVREDLGSATIRPTWDEEKCCRLEGGKTSFLSIQNSWNNGWEKKRVWNKPTPKTMQNIG